MPRSEVTDTRKFSEAKGEGTTRITLTNHSNHVAFFLRAEITKGANGEEVLPIIYDDNYITLYPHEARTLVATFAMSASDGRPVALRVEGYNLAKMIVTTSHLPAWVLVWLRNNSAFDIAMKWRTWYDILT